MKSQMSDTRRNSHGSNSRDFEVQPPPLTPDYMSTLYCSPRHPLVRLPDKSPELFGPVFGHEVVKPGDNDLIVNFASPGEAAIGERIVVIGRLLDESGRGVPSSLVEFWQANAGGRYRHSKDANAAPLDPNFGGCGRTVTDEFGNFSLRTIKPGPYPWLNGGNDWRPSHIHFSLFGNNFCQRLVTQICFEGDPRIRNCAIVAAIPDSSAVERLIARIKIENTIPMDIRAYRIDLVPRGRNSTVFENRLEGN